MAKLRCRAPARPSLLLLLCDGIGRELLYEELRSGKLVAHSARRRAELARTVDAVLGDEPCFAKVTDLLLTLRLGDRDGGSQDTREAVPARAAR